MQQIRVSGRPEVASLLRSIAEGIDSGRIQMGDGSFACPPEVEAVVDCPVGDEPVTVVTVVLNPAERARRRSGLGVEQELTHPGG